MIRIDYKDSRPIYEQIVDKFKYLILVGVMKEDEQMPSVRSLAMELSTNPNTVQKAYAELERQGFLYAVKGRGNFVQKNETLREQKKEELVQELVRWMKDAKSMEFDVDELSQEARGSHDRN